MTQRIPSSTIDEELQAEVQRLMRQDQKTLIEMGSLGSKWDKKKGTIISKIQASTYAKKEAILKQQTLHFFWTNYHINLQGYFSPKEFISKTQNPSFQQESIIVYGVDFMSPTRIYTYFRYFMPTNILWINDSTCKITFKFCAFAKKAILYNLAQGCGTIYKLQKERWYSLKPYHILGFERALQARIATNFDMGVPMLQNSQFLKYEQARRLFLQKMQKTTIRQCQFRHLFLQEHSNSMLSGTNIQDLLSNPRDLTKPSLQQLLNHTHLQQQQRQPFVTNITEINNMESLNNNSGIPTFSLAGSSPIVAEVPLADEQSLLQYLHSLKLQTQVPGVFNQSALNNLYST